MKTRGYSLWFQPENSIYQKYDSIIRQLSRKYNTPYFEPHITLLGQIELSEKKCLDKTKKLAFQLKPFIAKFTAIKFEDFYFRALYAKVDPNPLFASFEKTIRLFGINSNSQYMPHLSLLYGNLPLKIKEKIKRQINISFLPSFKIASIHLFKTNGTPKTWKRINVSSIE